MGPIRLMKAAYVIASAQVVGDTVICPSCNTEFTKTHYQQKFCKSLNSTCKDYYWNNVTPNKRNNRTRISPRSAAFMRQREIDRTDFDDDQSWDAHKS